MKKNVLAIIFVFLASATVFSQKKGNLTINTSYDWNEKTKSWEWKIKTEYEFYPFYFKRDLIMPKNQYIGENMLTKGINYKWSKTDWIEDEISTYYWSEKK